MRRAIIVLLSIPSLIAGVSISMLSSPRDANVSLAMARAFRTNDLPRLSIPFYTYTMYRAPQHAIVPRSRGMAYDAIGQFDAAIADYDLSEKLEPQVAYTNYLRAETYAKLRRHEDALKDFDAAIKKEPKSPWYRYQRAKHLVANEKFWPAISDFSAIMAMRNLEWTRYALRQRAYVYERLGKPEKMWSDTIAAKQLRCKGVLRHNCHMAVLFRVGRLQQSMVGLEESLASIKQSGARMEEAMAKIRSQQKPTSP